MARLEALGINFLALDFDCTILNTHTGGRWQGSAEALIPFVRPMFRDLLQAAVARQQMQIAIVTFTPQIALVRGVLEQIVGPQAAERIPIRGSDRSWHYYGAGSLEGKQPHMASAVEELTANNPGIVVAKNTTLLIDDDPKNVRSALQDGTRAIWLDPENPNRLFGDIVKLV